MDHKNFAKNWLALIGEIGIGNAEIAVFYIDGTISYSELSHLIGKAKAEKVRRVFGIHASE